MNRQRDWLAIILASSAIVMSAGLQPATATEGTMLESKGVKTWYAVHGRGEPVILIHGWLSSSRMNWDLPGTTALLSRDFQVVTLDVRGHGSSDKPLDESAYGTELVEDVLRVMDHLKLEKAHIVGYSMGGIIALNFLAKHPDRALSGALGGMGWMKEGGFGQNWFAQIGKNDPNTRALSICGRSLAQLALTEDDLTKIKVPMTVLVGDRDRIVQRLYVDPFRQVRPDISIIEIPNAGHLNCIAQKEFQQSLEYFLKKQKIR